MRKIIHGLISLFSLKLAISKSLKKKKNFFLNNKLKSKSKKQINLI
jgi:hypothetical protein